MRTVEGVLLNEHPAPNQAQGSWHLQCTDPQGELVELVLPYDQGRFLFVLLFGLVQERAILPLFLPPK